MQLAVLQPAYPDARDVAATCRTVQSMRDELARLVPGRCDLLLLPEYSNCPGADCADDIRAAMADDDGALLRDAAACARRCGMAVAVGVVVETGGRLHNRTLFFGRDGETVGFYDKLHLTHSESTAMQLHAGCDVTVLQWEGLRVGFMTCFDVYFPELAVALRRQRVDIVLSPSYQRSESPWRIAAMSQVRAIDIGAVLLRASYAMNAGSGGHSLICDASGRIVINAEQACGVFVGQADVGDGWTKPRSYGGEPIEHRRLIEDASRVDPGAA